MVRKKAGIAPMQMDLRAKPLPRGRVKCLLSQLSPAGFVNGE